MRSVKMFSRRYVLSALSAAALIAASPGIGSAAGNSGTSGNGGSKGNAGNGNNGGYGSSNGKAKGNAAEPGDAASSLAHSTNPTVRIRHRNGFQEVLIGGRYRLIDNRGRTIVDRPAAAKDMVRLQRMTAP